MKRFLALLLVAASASGAASGAPVADALDRPALTVRDASRAVLLGAARCGGRLIAVGERGIVASSADGGTTWQQSRVPVAVTLTAVRCPDAQNIFVTGHGGTVLASADGGATWTRRLDGRRAAQLVLEAARRIGDARLLKDAERLLAEGPDKPFLDLHFFDARRGMVVGAYGLAFTTQDGGQSWQVLTQRLPNPKGNHLYAIRVQGETLLVAGEQGLVLLSSDGGREFRKLELPYKGSFFTAELAGERDFIVAGLRGNVWRSTDAGATWTQLSSPTPATVTASTITHDRVVFFASQAGEVLQLKEAGLVAIKAPQLPPVNALQEANGGVVAFSVQGAIALPRQAASP